MRVTKTSPSLTYTEGGSGGVITNHYVRFFKKTFSASVLLAKIDFENIIRKEAQNPEYASWKIMSFVYWAWAKQHPQRKYRAQAIAYLRKAIELDPHYLAGRKRSEELMTKFAN